MSDKEGVTGFTASLGRFYKSDEFSDITIRCEGYEFKTHKLVLANHSPVFKKLLSGKWKVKHPMVPLLPLSKHPRVVHDLQIRQYRTRPILSC
jgi:hypothetical protein